MVLPAPSEFSAHAPNDEALAQLIKKHYTTTTLNFFINGTKITLVNPNPHWTLLDFIRTQHGLKGTKLGCGEVDNHISSWTVSNPSIGRLWSMHSRGSSTGY